MHRPHLPLSAKSLRNLMVALALSTSLVGPAALAQATTPRARVEQALLAIDSPAPATFWQHLGGEGLRSLEAILNDRQAPPALRRRAVYAARFYGESARSLLTARLHDAREDLTLRRYAALAMAEGLGVAAIDALVPLLNHEEAGMRAGVVIALSRLNDAHARSLLEARRRVEQDRVVRLELDQALSR